MDLGGTGGGGEYDQDILYEILKLMKRLLKNKTKSLRVPLFQIS